MQLRNFTFNKLIIIVIAISIFFLLSVNIIPILLTQTNQVITADSMKPELDQATNNCLEENRKNISNDLVFLENKDNNTNILFNKYEGYSIIIPKNWKLDNANYEHAVILYGQDFKLSIFKQKIDRSYDDTATYISYSHLKIRENHADISHLGDEIRVLGNFQVEAIFWNRKKITTIENDLNFYYSYNIILDENTVFTFILKSNQNSIGYYKNLSDRIIADMTLFYNHKGTIINIPEKQIQDITIKGDRLTFQIPKDKLVFGIFHKPNDNFWNELRSLEHEVEFRFEFIMDYYHLAIPYDMIKKQISQIYSDGRIMLVTLQPYLSMDMTHRVYDGSVIIPKVANGEYDQQILEWAIGLKDLKEPVFLRFANEMNGDWTEWCSWNYALDPDIFIMAWSRVHSIFQQIQASNVQLIWNPHDRDYPTYKWNSQHLYYPGDSKVDWIGITAYNNGVTRPNEEWREFDQAYFELYKEYMLRYSSKPFIITEFACNEIGGDKARWIQDGLNSLSVNYPNIRIAVWWNGIDDTWIYQIDSSEASKEAFRESISNPYYFRNPVS